MAPGRHRAALLVPQQAVLASPAPPAERGGVTGSPVPRRRTAAMLLRCCPGHGDAPALRVPGRPRSRRDKGALGKRGKRGNGVMSRGGGQPALPRAARIRRGPVTGTPAVASTRVQAGPGRTSAAAALAIVSARVQLTRTANQQLTAPRHQRSPVLP